MGIPDRWFSLVESGGEGDWKMGEITAFLANRRESEKYVSYVESHDQCLVGGQTLGEYLDDVHLLSMLSVSYKLKI